MKNSKSTWIALFVMGCILMNCIGKYAASMLQLPVWLDSAGTILTAYCLGPVCGAIVGASVNIIYGFSNSMSYIYSLTSILIGVVVGICARKNMFHDVFGTLSVGFFVSVVSACVSTPLNYFFFEGYTGNPWGNAVVDFLREQGCHRPFCYIIGEFYMDFLDKVFLLGLLYIAIVFRRKIIQKYKGWIKARKKRNVAGILIFVLLVGSFLLSAQTAEAGRRGEKQKNQDYNSYVRTVYNNENGLPTGTATAIAQTNDGDLWIGTYNGLYRYNGSQFQWMNEFDTVKNVNCLYTDEEGRLWVGTNDNGLSICIDGEVTNMLDVEKGMPSDSIRCIAGGNDGNYYVGTTDSMVIVSINSGISVKEILPEITYAASVSVDSAGRAAVVTDEGMLYLVDGNQIVAKKEHSAAGKNYSCCTFDDAGTLYAGTVENEIECYEIGESGFITQKVIQCGSLTNLKEIHSSEDKEMFICADNGIGYLDTSGKYQRVNANEFNSSIDHMLMDYQGNLWFTSSRLGLLKLCQSPFTEIYGKLGMNGQVVNAVTKWNGGLYFGTDNGLDLVDESLTKQKQNWLTKRLKGVRIRNFLVDSENRLWIATSGEGVWCVTSDQKVTVYDRKNGALGEKFRMALELADGTIVLSGDSGVTYVKNAVVTGTIGESDALPNAKVLCMAEMQDGKILAGTDGNGIAVLENQKVTKQIRRADGLSSNIILRICKDTEGQGYFIVTGGGLCYLDEEGTVQQLDQFPYYNNFDIVQDGETLFVLGSAGIYVVERETLLKGEEMDGVLLDSKKGLRDSLTANAWTYQDDQNNLYLAGSTGVIRMNLKSYDMALRSYRMRLQSVTIDGKNYPMSQGKTLSIGSGAKRIEIVPEIVNYSSSDPYISVYLKGIDDEPRLIRQSEVTSVIYTNLPAGSYTLELAVVDEHGTVLSENSYPVEKEYEMYEHKWFLVYFVVVFAIIIAYVVWLLFWTQIQRTLEMQKRELEMAQKQVQMGNETILTIARTVDAKDVNTSQHSLRVSEYAVMIALHIGYDEKSLEELRNTALLHDIGKIGIPDSILNKPSRLTDEEYEIMKSHVVKGAEILKNFTSIDHIVEGALYHHERYDGRCYVHGLKGEEIPINARIIGIADAFDAMTANRVYRKNQGVDFAVSELEKGRGTQFDPDLVDVMLYLIKSGEITLG